MLKNAIKMSLNIQRDFPKFLGYQEIWVFKEEKVIQPYASL